MSKNKIRHVSVIGTGLIGISWVVHFLNRGMEVTAGDPAPDSEKRLRDQVKLYAPSAPQDLLYFEKDITKAVKRAQFVQESAPERIELKKELFKEMDAATDASVLLVSSSSSITPSEFQMAAAHPERILLGHPFNPPHLIPLVEVCGGKATSEEAITQTIDFYRTMGKTPIRMQKEAIGHVANRLQAALWQEAFSLVKEGVATTEDIDLAISQGPGLRWALLGPFLNLHLAGGEGGIKYALEHLGKPFGKIMKDLGKLEIDDKLISLLSGGVANQLEDKDFSKILQQRNEVLTSLMKMKSKTDLP